MQSLDVISVNIWQILISLINLVLLYLILRRFLYRPVKLVIEKRQSELDARYRAAEEAQSAAEASREKWESTLSTARSQADEIINSASENAKWRGETIVNEAKTRAGGIIRQAEQEAELERKKALDDIRRQIVDVSGALSEKILEREINQQDHRALIDSFIDKIGERDE